MSETLFPGIVSEMFTFWERRALTYFTIKYNSSGTQQWAQRFSNQFNLGTTACGISIDNNNIYVAGISQKTFDTTTFKGTNQIVTLKYNSSGELLWTRYFGDSADF